MYRIEETYSNKKINPVVFSKNDLIFAISMLVIGFLYWNLNTFPYLGAGTTLFAGIFCVAIAIYLKTKGFRQTKESYVCLIIIALSALYFLLYDNDLLKGLNFIFISICSVYWVFLSTNSVRQVKITIIGDLFNQFIIVPFSNFNCCFAGLFHNINNNKHSKGFLAALLGLIVFLPVLLIVASLLMSADAAFEQFINNIQFTISERMAEYIVQIIFGIPVACYLFGLIFGNANKRHTDHLTEETIMENIKRVQFAPVITVYSALTALNGLYLLFFFSQLSYLFSAFENDLPTSLTYAEYARRGFFELCTVAGINLFVLIVAYLITNRKSYNWEKKDADPTPRILKAETLAICIFTIMLIAAAASKMVMYINYYGLTRLRVYTSWFMILLLFIFIIIAIRQFKHFIGTRMFIIFFTIFFIALCYGNTDAHIAKYNIGRYMDGTLESVDVAALAKLSDAAIPHIYKFYKQTQDAELKKSLKNVILSEHEENYTFREFNLQKHEAEKIRRNI